SQTASSWMAGVIVVDYTGAQSKAILRTIYDCIPRVGLHHTIPGPRHGKKSLSTPLGCRTTTTLTNGNGNRQCDSLLSPRYHLLKSPLCCYCAHELGFRIYLSRFCFL